MDPCNFCNDLRNERKLFVCAVYVPHFFGEDETLSLPKAFGNV